ncbi:MAG: flippase-like domain-containing protein [Actinomycetota bacterium]|nr:flippase-like domain-containing protein [Actinomycetota bacterium]
MDRLRNNLVLALALGVAVYFFLIVFAGFGEFAAALERFDWSLLPAIFGLVAASYAVRFLRWSYYLGLLGVRVPVAKNAAIFVAGLSMTVSPGKLGEVLKSVFVRRLTGDPVARTAPAVVAERVTDGTGMVAWGLLGALAFGLGPGGLLLFLALAVVATAALRSKRLSLLAERAFARVPLARRLVPHLGDFHGASDRLLAAGPLAVGTAASFLSWGLEISAVHLCVFASGAEGVRFLVTAFVFAAATLGGVVSMLPGGLGSAEAIMIGGFTTAAGLPTGLAGALTLVIRLVTLWFATFLGLAGLLLLRRALGDPSEADRRG